MADIYVDSNATGGSQTGADWANAYLTLGAAAAVDSAGDTIWVASDHSESGVISGLAWAGTQASPVRIISADKTSGEPPSIYSAGGQVAATGALSFSTSANYVHCIGLTLITGSGAATTTHFIPCTSSTGLTTFDNCSIRIDSTGSGSQIQLGTTKLSNCTFRFGSTGQGFSLGGATSAVIDGGSIEAGGSAITTLLVGSNNGVLFYLSGFDLSNAAAGVDVCNTTSPGTKVTLRNCKLPTSWSGSLNNSASSNLTEIKLHNTDAADINYALSVDTQFGTIVHETTLVKSGGASDGTTSISWEMTTNADAEWSHQTLDSPEIHRWFPDTEAGESLGVSTTIEIDILHDSVTNLQDDEVWIELQYLGTSGFPLSLFTDDAAATYTTTPADQAASTATWVTTGMTNPNKQKLSVTFTPQEAGFLILKVKLAKPSYTIYVDPYPTITQ